MRISDWSSDVCSSDLCVDCHGEEGNAPIDASYPKLGGQYHDYLAHSLQEYRNGNREHALMSQQAKDLTDQQIADLAAYFGSRPSHLRDLHGVNNRSEEHTSELPSLMRNSYAGFSLKK